MPGSPATVARLLAVLLFVACSGYFLNLGAASIWDANEAFYVETPREMIERGDYVNPTFNYEPRVNKPVLSYWIVAGLYHLFGVSVAVQRTAIAACALIMIACVFLLGRAASAQPLTALLAAAGLAANPRFFMFARRILIDMNLTMLMTVTLTCFALAERFPSRRRAWMLAMYVSVGLGVLAKGPVAVVLPALAFGLYLLAFGEWRRIGQMYLVSGTAIVLAIVLPYYAALYVQSGWTHILSFLVGENIERFTSLIGPQGRPAWFYLPVVFSDGLPWSLCLPGAVVLWWRERRTAQYEPDFRVRTLLLIWTVTIVGFFSFSQTKQDLYIFPIVGAVTVLGADLVARGLAATGSRRWVYGSLAAGGAAMALAGAAILYLFARAGVVYPLEGARASGTLLVAGGVVVVGLLAGRRLASAVVATLTTTIAFCWLLMWSVLPGFEQYKPVVPLSRAVERHWQPGDLIVHFDVALPSMVFYLRRPIDMHFEETTFVAVMQSARPVLAVLPEDEYGALRDRLGVTTCVLDKRPTSDIKLREILAGEPPPAVLLISTRCA